MVHIRPPNPITDDGIEVLWPGRRTYPRWLRRRELPWMALDGVGESLLPHDYQHSWRLTTSIAMQFTLILAALFGTIGVIVVPETSAPRILQTRAKRLRHETQNWALHAKADENQITFDTIRHIYLMRPWTMIAQEPILACLTAYMSYLYGTLYLLFEAVSKY